MCQICGMPGLNYGNASAYDGEFRNFGGSGGNSATTQALTGNQNVDGVISGLKWAGGTLTYSFPTLASQYESGISEKDSGFAVASEALKTATRYAMNLVSEYTNLATTEVDPSTTNADVRTAISTEANPTAYAYYPSNGSSGGDIWYGTNYPQYQNPIKGQYAWTTVIHELGHALGLKHGHETGGPANTAMQSAFDQMAYSVMTYRSYQNGPLTGYSNELNGYAQTYMMYDIAALQQMYGANFNTRSTNTTYSWSSTTGEMSINGAGQGAPGGNRIFMTVWDGGGTDTYDFSNYTNSLTINLSPGSFSITSSTQRANLGGGNTAPGNVFNALMYNNDTRSLIENAIGGSSNDSITGNDADNDLDGRGGTDTLTGGNGNDTYRVDLSTDVVVESSGQGTDRVISTAVSFTLSAHVENLVMTGTAVTGNGNELDNDIDGSGSAQNLVLAGLDGNDTMRGGSGRDAINGGAGVDYIYGGSNVDDLRGDAGDDRLWGEDGDDLFVGGAGADIFTGGSGRDEVAYQTASSGVFVDLAQDIGRYGDAEGDRFGSIENLIGSAHNDELLGDNGDNWIYGLAGNDFLRGDTGADILIGGGGADNLTGGSGEDSTSYHNSDSGVRVVLFQGIGRYGDAEGDVFGSIEEVIGSQYVDTIFGDNAANRLYGLGGADEIYGETGNDSIDGGDGNDYLHGGDGLDTLFGRAGQDTLIGGSDADTFMFTSTSDSLVASADTISDFSQAQGDQINLAGIDANSGAGGDQAFAFIGNGAFTSTAGQLRFSAGVLEGDVNGDGVADFRVNVTGLVTMVAGDFVL